MKNYREIAEEWLKGDFDPQTKARVAELRDNDPAGLEDAFYKNLEFGTGGLRGIMDAGTNRMNRYTVGMATQGLANYMKSHADGKANMVQEILKAGLKVNSDVFEQPLLVSAAKAGNVEIVKLLLKAHARKDAKDSQGNVAADYARGEVARLLK